MKTPMDASAPTLTDNPSGHALPPARPAAACPRRRLAIMLGLGLTLATPAQADQDAFAQCMQQLRAAAPASKLSTQAFDRFTAGLAPDMTVLPLLDRQPEFTTPIWDYLSALVDDERVADGRERLAEWQATLAAVEAAYGVDPATVVAVWGVESNFGRTFGKRPLVSSLATLSCFGRRQSFFRGEFMTTLKILDEGHVAPEALVGSWAGAFGHTQFMPSTFMRIAVDFDGDGRRDLIGSIPDALASTANYLRKSGWKTGQPWGFEVSLPAGYRAAESGRKSKRPMQHWISQGIRMVDGSALPPQSAPAGLLLPAGVDGPAFLVFANFDAIYSYNAAESYALAIAHLSDRLRGGDTFARAWPTDDPGISRAERREVQRKLIALGHDIGEADGIIGSASRKAIEVEQRRLGMPADGRAGRKLLEALRAQGGA